ncbi:hypothetical protein [Microbacterium sp. zg.Y909]|uniref:hypothetical protein n=1 Tax=Microbacterium sp. zg.Y909 TaxID=2969413 RepID=UPI00214AF562|nr:hypothetical protein [Microbacterium sp. zg.Y909]MCR2825044.1 hypothetical protein [Microbacterium sp. zg.Y909]
MFAMIQPATLPLVETAERARAAGEVATVPQGMNIAGVDAATEAVRADYGRTSRWLLGLLGTTGDAAAGLAAIFAGFGLSVAGTDPATAALSGAVGVVIALALALPSTLLLWRLHLSGRRLARATAFWAALPYLSGARRPVPGDYFAVRFLAYSPDLLIRVISSVGAFLAAVFSLSMIFYATAVDPDPTLAVIAVLWSVLFVAVTIGQFGGIQRIQVGYSHRDPLGYERRMRRART